MLSSCGIYSFTGASIADNIKLVNVNYFLNHASIVNPKLSNLLTQELRNRFLNETTLKLTDNESLADIIYKGVITSYDISSIASQGNETTARNRLTIHIMVDYINRYDEKQNFNLAFSRFADFEATQSIESVEDRLIKEINMLLVDEIFNRSLANW